MERYRAILKEYWGYDDFRGIQRDIIESICNGHDTLGLMPTGGGKSITFQVPALAMDGVCIVITPLIALMKDQVLHLRQRGIQAAAIYSDMSRDEILKALENSIFGGMKLLYVSPERLSSELFQTKLRRIKVSFIAIDEAHCISQWGYDFRPSYLEIAKIRKLVNHGQPTPVLALTATATPRVVDDIQNRLEFARPNVFKMSFERKNLAYVVRHTDDKYHQLIDILEAVPGSAIVYTRSRMRTKEFSDYLNTHLHVESGKKAATYFHAGLDFSVRDERQTAWQKNEIRVMVATNAFGMGIDKPDVRLVIHIDCPSSIEAYFQEAGRAGRDGKKAYAVLLFQKNDERLLEERINNTFPPKDYILQVYEHLAYYYQMAVGDGFGVTREFDIVRFCTTYHHYPVRADAALRILSRAGWIHYEEDPDTASRILFLLTRNELYRLNDVSPHEDAVITALLREYGGLFVDYVYISIPLLAQQTGLTNDQVYLCLKALDTRRIVHFIPQRKMPTITWSQRREETERVVIPPSIYEDRRKEFAKRIRAMIFYATNDAQCRSRQLLNYFGETNANDCHICDVCLSQRPQPLPRIGTLRVEGDGIVAEGWDDMSCKVLHLLADGNAHTLLELRELGKNHREELNASLRLLLYEEIIEADAHLYRLNMRIIKTSK